MNEKRDIPRTRSFVVAVSFILEEAISQSQSRYRPKICIERIKNRSARTFRKTFSAQHFVIAFHTAFENFRDAVSFVETGREGLDLS